jgi:hypothetical protein
MNFISEFTASTSAGDNPLILGTGFHSLGARKFDISAACTSGKRGRRGRPTFQGLWDDFCHTCGLVDDCISSSKSTCQDLSMTDLMDVSRLRPGFIT